MSKLWADTQDFVLAPMKKALFGKGTIAGLTAGFFGADDDGALGRPAPPGQTFEPGLHRRRRHRAGQWPPPPLAASRSRIT